jgi:hypothetical protein
MKGGFDKSNPYRRRTRTDKSKPYVRRSNPDIRKIKTVQSFIYLQRWA